MALLAIHVAPPAAAQPGSPELVRVQYNGVELQRVIRDIGTATDTRFIFGEEVRGVVTIAVPKPVTKGMALELLRAALFVKGYAQLPAAGGAYKILPIAATPSESEFVERSLDPESEKAITTLVTLSHIEASRVVETIKPLAPSSGAVVAYPPSNAIILSGTESAIGRLLAIVRLLDDAAGEDLWTRVVRYRSVDEMIEMADAVLNDGWSEPNQIVFRSDARTNTLLAQASQERLDELRAFVERFDRFEPGSGGIHVVRVQNRDADEIVDIISRLQSGSSSSERDEPADTPRDEGDAGDEDDGGDDGTDALDDGASTGLDLPTSETARSLEGLEFSLTSDPASRSIIIQAARSEARVVADMISELDRIAPRVAVEILYYEVQRPRGFVLSFDVTGTFSPSGNTAIRVSSSPTGPAGTPTAADAEGAFARVGNAPVIGTVQNPITGETVEVFRLPTNEATVNASATGTTAALLSRPTLTVMSGEEHELFVGNNVPIPVSAGARSVVTSDGTTVDAPLNPLTQTQVIEREDVGVRLRIRPTVGEQGSVRLDLTFELDEVVPSAVGAPTREVGVTLVQRIVESRSVLPPDEYVLLGMHEEKSLAYSRNGIPVLMNIPGLGLLFSRLEEREVNTRLMVVARARLLQSPADDIAETIRQRMAFERSMSRVNDLSRIPDRPWAVRLATFQRRDDARRVADDFEGDGYVTRVTKWEGAADESYWDVYLIGYADYETASIVALQASEADWDGEVLLVPAINEMAPED